MGLLPAEHLIEPPAGAVRDPPKPLPIVIPKVKAEGEIVVGCRIGGEVVAGELSDAEFEERKMHGTQYSSAAVGETRGVTEEEILLESDGFECARTPATAPPTSARPALPAASEVRSMLAGTCPRRCGSASR